MACGLLGGMIFGENGIFGIAPIAIIACFANSNGGIYAALAGEYGDGTDVGAVSILALNDGPFFTMLALGAAGYSVPVNTLAGCVVPILAGVILGNLDPEIRKFCEPGATMLIPFFAFPLGAGDVVLICKSRNPWNHAGRVRYSDHRNDRISGYTSF